MDNGAALCILDEIPDNLLKEDLTEVIIVDDAVKALESMAKFARSRSKAKFLGVTGSVGKTSVKEMLKIALSVFGETYATKGNFNNYFGLPLTLTNMPLDTEFAVYELGMSTKGEISYLSNIVVPDVSIITNVEAVHLENFESVEGIAYAKAEIFDGMKKDSHAVLNASNKYFDLLSEVADKKGLKIISYGTEKSDLYAKSYSINSGSMNIIANCFGAEIKYSINALALQHINNSCGILACVRALGLNVEVAAKQLQNFSMPKGRGKIINANNNITVIDESYNASPVSVKCAIQNLRLCAKDNVRTIAILADMKELGAESKFFHEDLSRTISENSIDKVVCIGEEMKHLYNALPQQKALGYFEDSVTAASKVTELLQVRDVVLIKGSRSMKTELIIDALT